MIAIGGEGYDPGPTPDHCAVCNKGEIVWPFPVNIKGKLTWACPECYRKENPGCMPVFEVEEVGPDAHLKLQGVSVGVPLEHEAVFKEGTSVFDTVMKLARDYYVNGVTYQEARKVLVSLGEGQEEWAKEALVNLCVGEREKSQLYSLGHRQTGPYKNKFEALYLTSHKGRTGSGLKFRAGEEIIKGAANG